MAWLMLVVAGLLETGWAIGLKYSEGFTRPIPSLLTGLAIARSLPIGTAYAVWVGIGTVGAVVLGILLFQESASPACLAFLGLLVLALVGLKATA